MKSAFQEMKEGGGLERLTAADHARVADAAANLALSNLAQLAFCVEANRRKEWMRHRKDDEGMRRCIAHVVSAKTGLERTGSLSVQDQEAQNSGVCVCVCV